MKKQVLFLIFSALAVAVSAQVEMSANNHNLPIRYTTQVVQIKGESVNGSPFLYLDWSDGKLHTPDGREYAMKFKYDVYNQAVHYYDGKDSMEINEPVASFTLLPEEGKEKVAHYFRKADQFGKNKNKGYYEVVKENKNAVLLKYYTMQIVNLNLSLGGSTGRKSLNLVCSYWLYVNGSKKLVELKNDFKNILLSVPVSAEKQAIIDALAFDYRSETDAVKLMEELDKP
jgi:hypothetical protein